MNRFRICTFSPWFVLRFTVAEGWMDGWMKARRWIPRVMDVIWTFAVAIVGDVPERWVPTAQKTPRLHFPCATGFPRAVATVLVPLSPISQSLPHRSDFVGVIHRSAGVPRILTAEILRISPQCIPTAEKSCDYSRVLTFSKREVTQQQTLVLSTFSGRSSC